MWDWMQRYVPARNPHGEEGGLHEEQSHRGAVSVVIETARKRKYCTDENMEKPDYVDTDAIQPVWYSLRKSSCGKTIFRFSSE